MLSISEFTAIFKSLWWSVMDYNPAPEKISVYYEGLKYYSLMTVKRVADQLTSNDKFPTLEVWRGMCYSYDKPLVTDPEEPIKEDRKFISKTVMGYLNRRTTGKEAYRLLQESGYEINMKNFDWFKDKGMFVFGKAMPENTTAP